MQSAVRQQTWKSKRVCTQFHQNLQVSSPTREANIGKEEQAALILAEPESGKEETQVTGPNWQQANLLAQIRSACRGEAKLLCDSCVSLPWSVCCVTVRVVEVVVVVLNGAAQLCALQWGGGQKAAAPPLQ